MASAIDVREKVEGPTSPVWGYRPQLDGLRAVAVYLVVAFHAGADRFVGGFIGVDVFFVLSGYLVTQILVRDVAASGRVALRRFYARRFRRLLPAAFVTLALTAVLFQALATRAEVSDALGAFRAAFLYVANWFFISESTEYFGADIEASPVVHFWSLAVEEQFYLLWPLLLSGLFLATGRLARQQTAIRAVVATGAVLSLVHALRLEGADLNRAYYGTDARAYQLLAGALLALSPRLFSLTEWQRVVLRRAAPVCLGAVVILATSLLDLGAIQRGVAITLVTCALLVAIENADTGPTARVLASSPLVYLGRISYGTYLWHWPVIVVATRVATPTPITLTVLSACVATAFASLSYQLLEHPVRRTPLLDQRRGIVIAAGLALSLVGALVVVPGILRTERTGGSIAAGTRSGSTPVPADIDWEAALADRPEFPDCLGGPAADCTLVRGSGQHVLLIGDSHARMLIPIFIELAESDDLTFSTAVFPVCPWQLDLYYDDGMADCREHKDDWYERLLGALDPDIVVLAHRPYDDPANSSRLVHPPGSEPIARFAPEYQRAVRETTAATVEHLRRDERAIVIVEPIPMAPAGADPLLCLSEADFLDDCRYVANGEPTPVEQTYRAVASSNDDVWTLDIDQLVCPYLPICDPIVEGLIVKRDPGHLTSTYAQTLTDEIRAYLSDEQILASSR